MPIRGFKDLENRMVELLERIEENTREVDVSQTNEIEGSSINERRGLLPREAIKIRETADLDPQQAALNPDGTITLSPGDRVRIAQYRGVPHAVLAYGAVDRPEVAYSVHTDSNPAVGPTRSPMGTINAPFSFVEHYGGAVPAQNSSAVWVERPAGATGTVDVAARLHLEVL
jgi:plastocyanin